MTTLKRNILIAKMISSISLIFFIFFHFSSEDSLYKLGAKLENVFSISTNISVRSMQTFLTTILSGVFASTLVALVFYYQEYKRSKEKLLLKIIDDIDKITSLYNKIPFFEYFIDSEYNRKALNYYLEYYRNKSCEIIKENIDTGIKKLDKSERRSAKIASNKGYKNSICNDKENELRSFIHDNESVSEISPNEKLDEIIQTIDFKIQEAAKAYNDIISFDLDPLLSTIIDVCDTKRYGYRKKTIIKRQIFDSEIIIPNLNTSKRDIIREFRKLINTSKKCSTKTIFDFESKYILSTKSIVERVGLIVKRSQTYIKALLETNDFDPNNDFRTEKTLGTLMFLQNCFLDIAELKMNTEILKTVYCKQAYVLTNLRQLLLFEISGRYNFVEKYKFAKPNDRYEGNRHVKWTIHNGQDLNPNIYRM